VLLNSIQEAAVVKREVTKLDVIRKHGRLVIRHWIFWQSHDVWGLSEPVADIILCLCLLNKLWWYL